MAATAVNLSVPAPADDTMEMSSPGQHNLDEDIDFDDYQPDGGGVQMNDDDRMTDDNEQGRPGTATDDMMEDDMQQAAVQEAEMQDSPSHAQVPEDEELIDYSDDELQDEIVEDAGLPNTVEQPAAASTTELPDQDVDEEIVRPLGDLDGEHVTAKVDEATSVTEQAPVAQPAEEQIFTAQENAGNPKGFAGETNQPESTDVAPPSEDAEEQTQEHGGSGIEEQQPLAQTSASKLEISLDTSTQHVVEGPATPTDTGLHAMVVRYGEHRFPLFKSRNQPDGLLKNDNLASLSLGELIQNCRQRLALKTGDILSEDQDLVLGFEQLGLILVEDSRAAFECSLDEVLDVFLQLHRNDDAEDIPPFFLNLSLQLKFTSSISVLKQAAAGGEGMSSFGFAHSGTEEQGGGIDHWEDDERGERGQEEFDEQYPQDDTAEGREHQQAAQVEGSIPEQQTADTNDYYEEHEDQEGEYEGQQDYYPEDQDYHEDLGEGTYYEDGQTEAAQLLDDHALAEGHDYEDSTGAVYNAPDDETAHAADDGAQSIVDATAEEEKAASAATSTTFQGDEGQDTTEQTSAGPVDFSTLLTEDDDEPPVQDAQQDAHDKGATGAADDHVDSEGQEVAPDDYLDQSNDPQPEQGQTEHQEDFDPAETHQSEVDGHQNGQADESIAPQEDPNHLDFQEGDDDDQFQTAYDLFDGAENDERGPEHSTAGNNAAAAQIAAATNADQHDDAEDFIDFDLDEETTVVDDKAKNPDAVAAGSHTPLAKRSFEDLAGEDEIDFDSPEPKKARAS